MIKELILPENWPKNGRTKRIKNLTNRRFWKLLVIKLAFSKNKKTYWECKCDCGNICNVSQQALTRKIKPRKSCGCLSLKLPNNGAGFNDILRTYISNSKHYNRIFELTKEEFRFLITQNCYYCGIEPLQENMGFKYNGLDRINNDNGYVTENIVTCCRTCNVMKMNHTQEQFYKKIEIIYNKHIKK